MLLAAALRVGNRRFLAIGNRRFRFHSPSSQASQDLPTRPPDRAIHMLYGKRHGAKPPGGRACKRRSWNNVHHSHRMAAQQRHQRGRHWCLN